MRSPWSEPSCTILDPLLEGRVLSAVLQKRLAVFVPGDLRSERLANFAAWMTGRNKWVTWTQFCKLACVSRSWRRALLEWSAMQSWLAIDNPGTSLLSTLRQFGRLRYLSITDSKLEGELLPALPEFSSTLESVAFKGCMSEPLDITDALLLRMAHLCKRLRSIVLENAEGITSIGITALAAACPLTVVTLRDCPGVSAEGVRALAILCPTLHSLSLNAERSEWMLDMTVVAASVALLAHLQYLNLSGTSCDDDGLNLIAAGCKQLSDLTLRDCCYLASASFADAAPSCLQHLACLNLSDCTGLNDDGARALARLSSRPGALLLHADNSTLVLVGCTSLTSTGLRAFSEGTPKSGQLHLPDVDEDVLACALGMKPTNCASGPHFLFMISSPDLSSCRFTQSGEVLISSWGGGASSEKLQQCSKLKHEYIHLLPEADRACHYEPSN